MANNQSLMSYHRNFMIDVLSSLVLLKMSRISSSLTRHRYSQLANFLILINNLKFGFIVRRYSSLVIPKCRCIRDHKLFYKKWISRNNNIEKNFFTPRLCLTIPWLLITKVRLFCYLYLTLKSKLSEIILFIKWVFSGS